MSLADCIGAALNRGAISKDEAEYLMARAKAFGDLGGADAKKAFGEMMSDEARETARREALAEKAQGAIYLDLRRFAAYTGEADIVTGAYRLFEDFGHAGFPSYRSMRNALQSEAIGRMDDFMHTFRRDAAMRRVNRAMIDDVVRAGFGENVSETAKALYGSWRGAAENLRAEFNRWGGHVAELKDWAFPQMHDAGAMMRAGLPAWRDFIKDRLDWERIKHPVTETPIASAERDDVLRRVFDNVVSDGWNSRDPATTPFGRGALFNQRDDARFLHFKNADAWLDYSREFGAGEPLGAMLDHINGLTRDVALMKRFGPNPAAMVEYLKQTVASEGARVKLEEPSMFPHEKKGRVDADVKSAQRNLDGFYDKARGSAMPSAPADVAMDMARDVQYGAKMGSAVLMHLGANPTLQMLGRFLQGHSLLQAPMDMIRGFSRGEADRAGMVLDDMLIHFEQGAREQSSWLRAREFTRWLPQITSRFSGLDAVAKASRRSAFMGQMASYGRFAEKGFGDLPPRLRENLAGVGIDGATWDKIRAAGTYGDGARSILRPQDISDYGARMAYRGLLHANNEVLVPSSNMRWGAYFAGAEKSDFAVRELSKSFSMFKSGFLATMWMTQVRQIQRELTRNGAAGVGAYVASSVIFLTLGGMLSTQLKQIRSLKDPRSMDPTTEDGLKTWGNAALASGALGFYGDFISSELSSYGHNLAETIAGPMATAADDLLHAPTSAKNALHFLRNNTPVLSTHWALSGGFNRLLLDQAQYMSDPNAHKAMRAQEQRVRRDTNQGYWWRPGELTPDRPPEFTLGR